MYFNIHSTVNIGLSMMYNISFIRPRCDFNGNTVYKSQRLIGRVCPSAILHFNVFCTQCEGLGVDRLFNNFTPLVWLSSGNSKDLTFILFNDFLFEFASLVWSRFSSCSVTYYFTYRISVIYVYIYRQYSFRTYIYTKLSFTIYE